LFDGSWKRVDRGQVGVCNTKGLLCFRFQGRRQADFVELCIAGT